MSFSPRKCLPVVAVAALAALVIAPTASAAPESQPEAAACRAPRLQTADGCVSRAAARRRIDSIVGDEMARQGLKATILRVDTGTRPLLSRGASETAYSTELFNRIARYLTPGHPGLAVKAPAASSTASQGPARGGDFAGLVRIDGGRKLYLRCSGSGGPTVVLISGARGGYDDWTHVVAGPEANPVPSPRAVFPRLAGAMHVCAYDRPGTVSFGGALAPSTPVRQPTTAAEGVADLHALLRAAGEQGPYILVAHSLGGMIGRLYASTYPEEIAGLVFVDPGSVFLKQTLTPGQWDRFARGARKLGKPKTIEPANYEGSIKQILAAPPAPKVPAVVLTSDHPFDFGAGGSETWPAWITAQNRLAAELGAEHVTHTDSGHYIAGERPALVVEAVRRVRKAPGDRSIGP